MFSNSKFQPAKLLIYTFSPPPIEQFLGYEKNQKKLLPAFGQTEKLKANTLRKKIFAI